MIDMTHMIATAPEAERPSSRWSPFNGSLRTRLVKD